MSDESVPLTIANSWFDGDLHTHLLVAPNEQPVARIRFDGVHDKSDDIIAEAEVEYLWHDADAPPIVEFHRFNLMAQTWQNRNGLLEQIADRTDPFDWREGIQDTINASIRQHRNASASHQMLTSADPDKEETPFLIAPLISSTGMTLWYSPPGTGKSFTALGAAVSVATGYPIMGRVPSKIGTVIYVDAEDDVMIHRIRMSAMLRKVGWEGDDPPIIHFAVTGRFKDALRPIRKLVREHEAVLVIVDSIGRTRDADASDGGATILLMNALGAMPCPVLAIDHVTKEDNKNIKRGKVDSPEAVMAIGSQFTTAAARLGWFFRDMDATASGTLNFTLYNTKHSHIPKQPPMAMSLVITSNEKMLPVEVEFKTWEKQMFFDVDKAQDNLVNMLVIHYRAERAMTVTELGMAAGVKAGTASSLVSRHSDLWEFVSGSKLRVLTEDGNAAARLHMQRQKGES